MSFELTHADRTRLSFARAERFDEQFPEMQHCVIVHPSPLNQEALIIGGNREAAWLLEHTADLRYWAWIALGAERLTIFNENAQIYSQQTFPFFESRVKSGLKLNKRSRLRTTSHGNCNPGTDRNHSERHENNG